MCLYISDRANFFNEYPYEVNGSNRQYELGSKAHKKSIGMMVLREVDPVC